jgi:tripartite-type tricarboxylate transporter receptor subunit TctC
MVCALLVSASAAAQDYPTKPIEVVVGFAPGGGTDTIARTVADMAQKHLGQPMVVVNKPGASGIIGAQQVAAAKPDGYTLLVAGGSETVSTPHYRQIPFSPVDDFEPIIRFMIERINFYVRNDSPWKTMQEFVADAKKNPDKFSYAHAGVGGLHYSTMVVTSKRAGFSMNHVPYKGGAETLAALAGGHVHVAMASPNEAFALVEAGRIRPLATASIQRSPTEPNTPTLRELGYDVYIENQKGFVAPKGTPKAIVQKLHESLKKVYDDPQFKANADKLKLELAYLGSEDFRKSMKAMHTQIGESVKDAPKK